MEEEWATERGPCELAEVFATRVEDGLETCLRLMSFNRVTTDLVGHASRCWLLGQVARVALLADPAMVAVLLGLLHALWQGWRIVRGLFGRRLQFLRTSNALAVHDAETVASGGREPAAVAATEAAAVAGGIPLHIVRPRCI